MLEGTLVGREVPQVARDERPSMSCHGSREDMLVVWVRQSELANIRLPALDLSVVKGAPHRSYEPCSPAVGLGLLQTHIDQLLDFALEQLRQDLAAPQRSVQVLHGEA